MLPGWQDFENLRMYMNDADLLQEFARSLGDDELLEICEFIARAHWFDFEEHELD